MAADQARAGGGGLLGVAARRTPAVNGKGIGVAIVDSGIANHSALAGKVVASVNFATGEIEHLRRVWPRHAHRRHHRRLDQLGPTSLYKNGIAPGAHLVNVRVLNREGRRLHERRDRGHSVGGRRTASSIRSE